MPVVDSARSATRRTDPRSRLRRRRPDAQARDDGPRCGRRRREPRSSRQGPREGLDAHVMDGQALTFENEFDAVFSNAALHWMKNPDAVIAGVARALKPWRALCRRVWRPRECARVCARRCASRLAARGMDPDAGRSLVLPVDDGLFGAPRGGWFHGAERGIDRTADAACRAMSTDGSRCLADSFLNQIDRRQASVPSIAEIQNRAAPDPALATMVAGSRTTSACASTRYLRLDPTRRALGPGGADFRPRPPAAEPKPIAVLARARQGHRPHDDVQGRR
jgi:SAM-dependent methyltransferase